MQSRDYITVNLERVKGRVKTNDTVTGLLWLLAGAVVYLLAIIIIDQASPLERAARLNLLAVLGVLAIVGLAVILLMPTLKRINDRYAARLIERQADDLFRNSLVSYVELRTNPTVAPGILSAVASKAARDLKEIDVDAVVDRRPLRRAAVGLCAAVALAALFAATTPKHFAPSLGRVVGIEIEPPTATVIANVRPLDGTTVMAGSDVTLAADVRGEVPASVSADVTRDGTYWDTLPMTLSPAGRWEAPLANLLQDARFRVRAGDARSPEHVVRVQALPAVTKVRTRLTFPRYTLLAPSEHDGGNVEALAGTQVEVIAETNREAARPLQLVWSDGDRTTTLQPVAGTREARGSFTVRRDESYFIRFYDPATGQVNQAPVHYRVKAISDRPPAVEVSGAAAQVSVPADGFVALGVRARDDYGLDRIALCLRKAAEKPRETGDADVETQPVRTLPPDRAALSVAEQVTLRPAEVGLVEGDEALVWFTATDRRPEGAQDGRSDEVRIIVTAPEGKGGGETADAGNGNPEQGDGGEPEPNGAGTDDAKVAMTPEERSDLQKMLDALETLRSAMPDGSGSEPREQTQPADTQGTEPQPKPAQPGTGDAASQDQPTGDGPATGAENQQRDRPKDADVGPRRTDFSETGRADGGARTDRQLLSTLGPELRKLDQEMRQGTVDEKLLEELGWNEEQLRRFVSEYTDRFGDFAAGSADDGTTTPGSRPRDGEVTAAAGDGGTVGGGMTSAERGTADDLGDNAETRRRRAASRFRRTIEAYRQAVSDAESESR